MLAGDLYKLGRTIVKNSGLIRKTGKPDIPRYLYHMTRKKNYEQILEKGLINAYSDTGHSDLCGVFMFDLKNFEKRWANTWFNIEDMKVNLGRALLSKHACEDSVIGKAHDIVMLRIPTKNMNINKLKIRRQDIMQFEDADSAIYQSVYTRRKIPIEYIYESDIDVSNVQKIGEMSVKIKNQDELKKIIELKPFDLLLKLFKCQPEEKGILAHQATYPKAKVHTLVE